MSKGWGPGRADEGGVIDFISLKRDKLQRGTEKARKEKYTRINLMNF